MGGVDRGGGPLRTRSLKYREGPRAHIKKEMGYLGAEDSDNVD